MNITFPIGFGLVAYFLFIIAVVAWGFFREYQMLNNCAEVNRYNIVHRSYLPFGSPFTRHSVYRITIIDENGVEKRGIVRCGGRWFGTLFSNEITIRWDK
jgi:hypothetical protein